MARFTSSKNLRDGPPCSSRLAASASTRQRRASAFETALRLNPSFSLAHGYYGLTLSYCGRWEEGTLAAERALLLSPRDPFSATYYGIASYAQFVGRNYDEAMRLARQGIRQLADFVGAHRVLTAAAGMAGPQTRLGFRPSSSMLD